MRLQWGLHEEGEMASEAQALPYAAGNVLIGGFQGEQVPGDFSDLLSQGHVGGAILFARNITDCEQAASLVQTLKTCRPDAWIGIDQEGGRVQRFAAPFPQLPPMRHLSASDKPEQLAAQAATVLSHALAMMGVHQNYAPVLDVDTNPDNPVIGDRAFASDPDLVSRMGFAFIRALQAGGVAACGKHFPGHGDTEVDSHVELPRLTHDLERLRRIELLPFAAAVRAQAASIMTAHVLFTPLDDTHLATLSEKIIEPLLRQELGYDGVVVSDDMEMGAITEHYGIEDAAVRALRAGCDQLLICHDIDLLIRAYDAIIRAVESGALPWARLQQASARIEAMKQRYQRLASRLEGVFESWRRLWPMPPG